MHTSSPDIKHKATIRSKLTLDRLSAGPPTRLHPKVTTYIDHVKLPHARCVLVIVCVPKHVDLKMQSLLQKYSIEVKEDRIERDLDRTFPMIEFFAKSPKDDPTGGQEMLKAMLRAYAAYDDEVRDRIRSLAIYPIWLAWRWS